MRLQWIPLVIFLLVNLGIDLFIFKKLKRSVRCSKWLASVHTVLAALLYAGLAFVVVMPLRTMDNDTMVLVMHLLYAFFALNAVKWILLCIYSLSWSKRLPQRMKPAVRIVACATAVAMLLIIGRGLWITPYCVEVNNVTLTFNNLPKEFDGYKIVQFSDTHLGTYRNDTAFVGKCVDKMNALHPDIICFTGDFVSRTTSEAYPFVSVFKRLKAKDGVLSIRGNHDNDEYFDWPSESAKQKDYDELRTLQESLGWTLLENEHFLVRRKGSAIAFIGTNNIDKHTPTPPVDGYLKQAYPNLNDSAFKILLQHNPQNWKGVYGKYPQINLMLAGHTHAMQMMLTLLGHKFSPATWVYDEWGGTYKDDKGRQLYVNIGMGMVGVPARIGATPEITVITLKRG